MPKKSNDKGSAFERQVCKKLSLWVSNGQRDDLFWRTSQSGGRATIGLQSGTKRSAQAGDIGVIDSLGQDLIHRYVVECKHYESLDLHRLPMGSGGRFFKFWNEACEDARNHSKLPILIAKQNFLPTLLAVDAKGQKSANQALRPRKAIYKLYSPVQGCYIYDFEEFLKHVEPGSFAHGSGTNHR